MTSKKIKFNIVLYQFTAILIWLSISVIQWSNHPKNSPGIYLPLIIRSTEAFSIWIISGIIILFLEKFRISLQKIYIILSLLPSLYFASILTNILSIYIRKLIGYAPPVVDNYFFIHSLHFYIPLVLVVVFYGVYKYQLKANLATENKLKAETSAEEAKWMMLRYQVNPHFLFNALNSIIALIGINEDKARKLVMELSEYFRYTLAHNKDALVDLKYEVEAVMTYLEIQKIRFDKKLDIETKFDQTLWNQKIPVFSLQALTENAVKYGIKTSEEKLKLKLQTKRVQDYFTISIENTGKLVEQEKESGDGIGLGIKNLKDRMFQLYGVENSFSLTQLKGSVLAEINIPYKHNEKN